MHVHYVATQILGGFDWFRHPCFVDLVRQQAFVPDDHHLHAALTRLCSENEDGCSFV